MKKSSFTRYKTPTPQQQQQPPESQTVQSEQRSAIPSAPEPAPAPAPTAQQWPPGTRPSVRSGHLLASTGLNDLDGIKRSWQ